MVSPSHHTRRALLPLVALVIIAGGVSFAAATSAATDSAPAEAASTSARAGAMRTHPWRDRIIVARGTATRRDGDIGFAIVDSRGRLLAGHDIHRRFASASVLKTMLLICHLRSPGVRGRALGTAEVRYLSPMIRRSADGPANDLWTRHRGCLPGLAREVGMRGFTTEPVWGRSRITPAGTARLFHRLERLVPARHQRLVLQLHGAIVPEQRWGLARNVPAGMKIHFKGGFAPSPGGGRTVSQGALLRSDHRLSVAVLTNHSPSHAYGTETLRMIGRVLLRGYPAGR